VTELKVVESPKGYYQLQGELNRNTIPKSDALSLVEQSFQNPTSGQIITLDMAGVKHADTAGLAWLMNLLKDSRQQNVQFEFKNIPESVVKLAKISDVDSFLSVQ
jgi:phospholipid transport system transporter-binding protein